MMFILSMQEHDKVEMTMFGWQTEYFELRFEKSEDTEKYFHKFSGDGLRYEMVDFLNRIGQAVTLNLAECLESCDVIEKFRYKENMVVVR